MKLRLLTTVLLLSVCARGHSTPQGELDSLRHRIAAHTISRVEILRVPDYILFSVGLTPARLERSAEYSVTLKNSSAFELAMTKLLAGMFVKESTNSSDVRWGVLFFDESGKEVGALFVDQFGRGMVNTEKVVFSPNLAVRLKGLIRELP